MPTQTLLAYPFRIFFLSSAIWALAAVGVWILVISGRMALPLGLPPLQWHQHEMLFGFLNPAIAGFLLTAVCAWTQTERLHGLPLMLLWLVWLAGRLLSTFGEPLPHMVVAAANLLFLPLVALDAGWRIWRARQRRQFLVLGVLVLLWLTQLGLLSNPMGRYSGGALVVAAVLMLVIGGRITPAFSGTWLRSRQRDASAIKSYRWLEAAMLASLVLLLIAVLATDGAMTGIMALLAGGLSLIRIGLWRGWLIREEPLLWTLHLSLLWIPVGFALLGTNQLLGWPPSAWKHAIGTGAMGTLIFAVMVRVALGHTGRALTLPDGMVVAYWMLFAAAVIRVLTALGLLPFQPGIVVAGVAWSLGFMLFLWRYTPILAAPRVDGKVG